MALHKLHKERGCCTKSQNRFIFGIIDSEGSNPPLLKLVVFSNFEIVR